MLIPHHPTSTNAFPNDWIPPAGTLQSALPWIAPRVPDELANLFRRLGSHHRVCPGEFLFNETQAVEHLVYVRTGLIGRAVINPDTRQEMVLALSPPRRMAAGTLNFFSGLPCVGKYFAFESSELICCPQSLVRAVIADNPGLIRSLAIHCELLALSNRLTSCSQLILPVRRRLPLFLLAWACAFGVWSKRHGGNESWIRAPLPVVRSDLARLVSTSVVTIDRQTAEWRSAGLLVREARTLWIKPALLEESLDWLCRLDESTGQVSRPQTLSDLIAAK